MSIRINRVRVKNFRSLKNVETTLGDVILLLGANNSGKTSFLRALTVGLSSDRKFISRDDLFINKEGKYPENPCVEVDIEIKPIESNVFPLEWAQVFASDIQINSRNEEFFAYKTIVDFSSQQIEAQIKRYVIKDWESEYADENEEITANISKLPLYFIDAQRDLQEDLKLAQSYFGRLASQIEYEESQKLQLETSLATLNQQSVENSIILTHLTNTLGELDKTLQSGGSSIEITPFPKKLRDLHKGIKVNFQDGDSETFGLEYHGMGTRSWASLLGYKAFVSWIKKKSDNEGDTIHPILALEEPEAHLHPNAQRKVYSQLINVTGQKIISTHSPYIVPLARIEELRLFYKTGDSTNIGDLKQLVEELTPKEKHSLETQIVKARGELFFARFVVLFEGQTEDGALPIFAKKHWGCEAFEKGICLMQCSGDAFKIYVLFLESLKIPWVIFSDYDTPEVKTKVNRIGTNLGIDVNSDNRFILLNASIEHYLINEGYRTELQKAYFTLKEPEYSDETKRVAERTRVESLSDEEFKNDNTIKNWKNKIASEWALSIIEHSDPTKQMPQKFLELFSVLDHQL